MIDEEVDDYNDDNQIGVGSTNPLVAVGSQIILPNQTNSRDAVTTKEKSAHKIGNILS